MDGVTILNKIVEPIIKTSHTAIVASIITVISLAVFCGAIFGIVGFIENDKKFESTVVGVAVIGMLLGIVIGLITSIIITSCNKIKIGENISYEVTTDNKVSLQEFYEKYDVIEQRGQIYVVKEKLTDGGEE